MVDLHHILPALLLGACAPAPDDGDSGTSGVGASFSLDLLLVTPANQSPTNDLASADVVIRDAQGSESRLSLSATAGSPAIEALPALENSTLSFEGFDATGALTTFGSTQPLTLSAGDSELGLLVSNVDAFAWLEPYDERLALAPVVAPGNGRFYVLGGTPHGPVHQPNATDEVLRFAASDPDDELALEPIFYLPDVAGFGTERVGHSATWLSDGDDGGLVLVAGGTKGYFVFDQVTDSAFLYDLSTGEAVDEMTMTETRWDHEAILNHSGDVVIIGGWDNDTQYNSPATSVEIYSPSSGEFDRPEGSPDSSIFMVYGAATSMEEYGVLYCSGFDVEGSTSADQTWQASDACFVVSNSGVLSYVAPMTQAVLAPALTYLGGGRVLLSGGLHTPEPVEDVYASVAATSALYIYDVESDTWSYPGVEMTNPRAHHVSIPLPDGRVLLAGGVASEELMLGGSSPGLACAEIFDPTNNSVTDLGSCSEDDETGPLPFRAALPTWATDPIHGTLVVGGLSEGKAVDTSALFVPYPGE